MCVLALVLFVLYAHSSVPLSSLLLISSDRTAAAYIASDETQLVSCLAALKKGISATHSTISNLVLA